MHCSSDTLILPDGGLLAAEAESTSSDDTWAESANQPPLSVLVTNFPIAPIESTYVPTAGLNRRDKRRSKCGAIGVELSGLLAHGAGTEWCSLGGASCLQ
ncbi:hypothetical protein IFM47457_06876 [Aspergillus lentulus]|nr:hypothetical protein IFM47457_06876 [Aspergillus lentulus]